MIMANLKNAFLSLGFFFILCCFGGSFAPAVSQYTELEEVEAVLAIQEFFAFESVDISECLEMNSIKAYVSESLPQ